MSASDPDVSGPGVLVASMLTGILTAFAALTQILLVRAADGTKGFWTRCADRAARFLAPREVKNSLDFWRTRLERFTLSLSDQQLITGFLVLILALVKYKPDDGLDIFKSTSDLFMALMTVYFSSTTHLVSMVALEPYLRANPLMMVGRTILVLSTLGLQLGVYIYGVAKVIWGCYLYVPLFMALTQATLGIIYTIFASEQTRLARKAVSNIGFLKFWEVYDTRELSIRDWVDTFERPTMHNMFDYLVNLPTFLTWGFFLLMNSKLLRRYQWLRWIIANILWWSGITAPLVVLSLGVIFVVLEMCEMYFPALSSTWSFGQLLPILLLLLPFFTLIETWSEHEKESTPDASHTIASQTSLSSRLSPPRRYQVSHHEIAGVRTRDSIEFRWVAGQSSRPRASSLPSHVTSA